MVTKRIPISALRVGMFVTGCDRSWLETPFLVHKFEVKTKAQVAKLVESGIQFVDIDLQRGVDVALPEPVADVRLVTVEPPPELQIPSGLDAASLAREFVEAQRAREHMLESVKGILESVRTSGIIPASQVKQVVGEVIAETLEHGHTLIALIRTREFDPDLYDHALSVGTLTVVLGRLLGYEGNGLENLAEAALIHDIGLLRLPRNLLKPLRPLSPSDQKVFAMHPQVGMEMLRQAGNVSEDVLQMVGEHHETPVAGRQVEDPGRAAVTRCTRLLNVVDAYDELLTGQGARPAMLPRVALQQLYLDAQQKRVDLEMASHLISQIGVYPIYSFVELNTGHRGVVTRVSPKDLLRPVVLLTHGPDRVLMDEPMPVDLVSLTEDHTRLEIVSVLDPKAEHVEVEELLAEWVAR